MKKFLVTTVALGMLAWAGSASANLITNGDFEDNGGSLDGWDVTTGIDIAQAGAITDIQGMNGHYALFGLRTSSDNSTLRQDFEVQGIDELTVSFDWAFDVVDWDETADDTFLS